MINVNHHYQQTKLEIYQNITNHNENNFKLYSDKCYQLYMICL